MKYDWDKFLDDHADYCSIYEMEQDYTEWLRLGNMLPAFDIDEMNMVVYVTNNPTQLEQALDNMVAAGLMDAPNV